MAKVFRITGSFQTGHHDQPFSKEVVADSDARARELMLSMLGSKHAVPRRLIQVKEIAEVPADKVEDPIIRHQAGL